ncbi:BCCT family transporter [Vibrio lentus]|nr:BCCT family transporter [Vibrio lentus]
MKALTFLLFFAITAQLPFPTLIAILFLILTTTFIVTTGDSMTYTISVVMTGTTEPERSRTYFLGYHHGCGSHCCCLQWVLAASHLPDRSL